MNSNGGSPLTTTEFKVLNTMSSSTDETIFSEDDSEDSDYDEGDEDDDGESDDVLHARMDEEIGTVGIDAPPPPFETLVDDDVDRALSVSVNEEMVEVVPTDMVESVVSLVSNLDLWFFIYIINAN